MSDDSTPPSSRSRLLRRSPADVIADLTGILTPKGVLTDPAEMEPFLTEWRGYRRGSALAVALPASTEEVAAVVGLANRAGVPVFPQGGNTGLSFGAVPGAARTGIVLALRRMTKVREIDRSSNILTVDAGTTLAAVHAAALSAGRTVPLHLGSEGTAQIGGLVSTNAGGTGAIRYGPMRDLVAGIEVVLPDGRILRDLAALRKNNTGYDLKHLFIGAEGTLGIVTAVALRMHPAMVAQAHAWVALEDCDSALDLLSRLQDRFDTSIMACELVSASEIDIVLRHIPRTRLPFESVPAWSMMIELGNPDGRVLLREALEELLAAALEAGVAADAVVAASDAQAADFWRVRHSVSEANKLFGHSLSHDVAVRIADVPEFIRTCDAALAERFPEALSVVVAHVGDGNIHYIALFGADAWAAVPDPDAVTLDVQTMVHDIVKRFDGSFSAEHGIGRKLTGEMERLVDPVRLQVMRDIKRLLDPDNLLNPGSLFAEDA